MAPILYSNSSTAQRVHDDISSNSHAYDRLDHKHLLTDLFTEDLMRMCIIPRPLALSERPLAELSQAEIDTLIEQNRENVRARKTFRSYI